MAEENKVRELYIRFQGTAQRFSENSGPKKAEGSFITQSVALAKRPGFDSIAGSWERGPPVRHGALSAGPDAD
jgi:hypothetical protein